MTLVSFYISISSGYMKVKCFCITLSMVKSFRCVIDFFICLLCCFQIKEKVDTDLLILTWTENITW